MASIPVTATINMPDGVTYQCQCVCTPIAKPPIANPPTINPPISNPPVVQPPPPSNPTPANPPPTNSPPTNPPTNKPPTAPNSHRYVAYHISWGTYARNFQPSDIPMNKITHLNYAFANIDASGKITIGDSYADVEKAFPGDVWDTTKQPYRGEFWQLRKLKAQYPQVKMMISVGGWSWSGRFSDVAATPAARSLFAQSCVDFITKWGFDGVDLDWEYPVQGGLNTNKYRPEDGRNYTLLLQAIRDAFGRLPGARKLLTIAAPAGPAISKYLEVQKLGQILDFMNIMTYDFRGGWSQFTGHHSPLYRSSVDPDRSLTETSSVIQYYLSNGFPSDKINIGAAFYGRGWSGVPKANNGLFQRFNGLPQGTWENGVFDYKDIKRRIKTGQLDRFWDDEVKAPYAYNASSGLMISYDDPQSITEKCKFIKDMKLGGIMVWELSSDDQNELTNTINANLNLGVKLASEPDTEISNAGNKAPVKRSFKNWFRLGNH